MLASTAQMMEGDGSMAVHGGRIEELVLRLPICALLVDRRGVIRQASPDAERLFGWGRAELVGSPVEILLPGPLRRAHVEQREAFGQAPRARRMGAGSRLQARHHDGELFPVDVLLEPLEDGTVLCVVVDRREIRAAEQALEESAQTFRTVMDRVQDVVYVVRGDAAVPAPQVVSVSEHVQSVLGYQASEFLADPMLWFAAIHPDDVPGVQRSIQEMLEQRQPVVRQYRLKHKLTGEWRTMEDRVAPLLDPSGTVIGSCGAARDVTDQKRLQGRLVLEDRMATLGVLSTCLAHELNNPLTYVLATVDQAARDIEAGKLDPQSLRGLLANAVDGATRMRDIIRDLGSLARESETATRIHPREALELAARLASSTLAGRAELVRDYGEVPSVLANQTRLAQVFLNLLVNAGQAIPKDRTQPGRVVVRTGTDELGRAVVEVSDDGEGVAAEALPRLFDPFFTTKGVGSGTGLGLYVSQGIVSALGGEIRVESEVGKGTRVRVVLPAAGSASAQEAKVS